VTNCFDNSVVGKTAVGNPVMVKLQVYGVGSVVVGLLSCLKWNNRCYFCGLL